MSLPGVLKHVRVLEDAGLVTTVKRGRVRECRLCDDALVAVAEWIARQQALWSTRLDALGTLLDAREGGGYRIRFGPRPDGNSYSETATFAAFEPVERLVLDVLTTGEGMAETSRVTVLLVPVDGGTRLELTVEGVSGRQAADGLKTGWQWCLEGIATELDVD